ncbi:MAG: FtsH protease activity modulator HflK [Alphaproteobacteria bacterium]
MPWTQGGGGGPGPWGSGPRGPMPPDLEDLLKSGQDRLRRLFPRGMGGGALVLSVAMLILLVWIGSGFYRVLPDEQGVVLRFGAYNRATTPGLNYHLPAPIESVLTPKVTFVNRIEIGFASAGQFARGAAMRQVPEESLMLTGDENIVDINFTVFWLIKDAKDFLFNIRAPESTVKAAAESAMREIIGQTPIASALAEGRGKVEQDTRALLQSILDSYGAGIQITQVQLQKVDPPGPVIDAFRDVQRARADQDRARNEAEGYRNDIIPRARGEAEQLLQQAEAYKQEVVARSEGDSKRFLSVYDQYKLAKDVTARRLYIETMQEVLKNSDKVILDKNAGSGVIPYLPLPELRKGSQAPSSAPAAGSTSPSTLAPAGVSAAPHATESRP